MCLGFLLLKAGMLQFWQSVVGHELELCMADPVDEKHVKLELHAAVPSGSLKLTESSECMDLYIVCYDGTKLCRDCFLQD